MRDKSRRTSDDSNVGYRDAGPRARLATLPLTEGILKERVFNDEIAKAASVLKIFTVENLAATLNCGCDDERVVPCKPVCLLESERLEKESGR